MTDPPPTHLTNPPTPPPQSSLLREVSTSDLHNLVGSTNDLTRQGNATPYQATIAAAALAATSKSKGKKAAAALASSYPSFTKAVKGSSVSIARSLRAVVAPLHYTFNDAELRDATKHTQLRNSIVKCPLSESQRIAYKKLVDDTRMVTALEGRNAQVSGGGVVVRGGAWWCVVVVRGGVWWW